MFFQVFCTAMAVWIGSSWIYNVLFHPLHPYPGPLLCRASFAPRLWHRLAGTSVMHAHRAHEKYGFVVRLSPTELSYISSEAWHDIYARHDGNAALPKEPAFNAAPPDFPRSIIQALDGPPHARQRRIFGPAFTNTALKKQETLILGHVRKLVANLQRMCESAGSEEAKANMSDLFNFLTFDVMADLAFGKPLGLLDTGTYSEWVKNVFAVFKLLSLRMVLGYYIPRVNKLVTKLLASEKMTERRKAHIAYAAGLVDERLNHAERHDRERPDIWSFVEKKQDVLTRPEMHINAAVFMAAGTETTATALCGIIWHLVNNREKIEKLLAEIRGVAVEGYTMETLANLPYLNAVINEGMRLYPPAPDMIYRLVPEGGAAICGDHVPAGTTVGLHQWPAYHSRHNFDRPEEFIPERWLVDTSGDMFGRNDTKVVQPFSKGPRICIGKNLALHEIRLALSHVLARFDLSFASESADWPLQQKAYVVWEKPALMIRVRKASVEQEVAETMSRLIARVGEEKGE